MALGLADLMKMSQAQMDELFCTSPPGPIPVGNARGTAIVDPGTTLSKVFAGIARWFFWQGKVFNAADATLLNKVSSFGIRAIKAAVYLGESWLDRKDCIVLDYSKTSWVAQKIRDEIRNVAPGIYLGVVYREKKRIANFVLEFASQTIAVEAEPKVLPAAEPAPH
jgi:hypothetical protein